MPNVFLTPDVIAKAALATLYNHAVLAGLVHRDFEADFNGKVGDTITVRKPSVFEANVFNRGTGIVLQDVDEDGVPVTLDTILDVSVAVTDEQMTMEIVDFAAQILTPAMEAINQGVDQRLAAKLVEVAGESVTVDEAKDLVDAKTALTQNAVPFTDRAAVHGSVLAGLLEKDPLFHEADKRGDTIGLREAEIGRKFGFDNFTDQNLDELGDDLGVAFHRTAVALVTRTLAVPEGGVKAAVESYKGLAVRVMYGYDITHKQQILSIDTLIGVADIDGANRAVLLNEAGT